MNNIQLTAKHRVKLLEMCKILFPDSKINTGLNKFYPDNWNDLWSKRPYLNIWIILNSGHFKTHPTS